MPKQLDRGGAQAQIKTTSQLLSQLLLAQRQGDRGKTSRSSTGLPTKHVTSARS